MMFRDMFGRMIELSPERWRHVSETHPEVRTRIDLIKKTLTMPDIVKRSVHAPNVSLFYKCYEYRYNGKYICVVIKILDEGCFISTAYRIGKIKKGGMVWTKS
ncbi:MAG: hypothetical protein C5S47_04195 [Candidatus Methanogasteraceae archaeon]|nr:MAG: hypothetical protein C5S47_04195 [ANME-2 cluster archaeon]